MRGYAAIAVAGFLSSCCGLASASISYTTVGSSVSQNFDSLSSTGWTNHSTLTGWHLFRQPAPGTAITAIAINDGGSNAGSFYSYGATGSSERALGGLGSGGSYFGSPESGAVAGWIAVALTNNTGAAIDNFTVGFRGEQWRNGGNTTAQVMAFEYGIGPTFDGVSTWVAPGGNFNWTSPITSATFSAIDGNDDGLVAGRGGSVTTGFNWNNGDTLWLRWIENNDAGNDHGLAIDDFSFSTRAPQVIPEATAIVIHGALFGLAGLIAARKANRRRVAA